MVHREISDKCGGTFWNVLTTNSPLSNVFPASGQFYIRTQIMGFPPRSASGFPGKRVLPKRAGITPRTLGFVEACPLTAWAIWSREIAPDAAAAFTKRSRASLVAELMRPSKSAAADIAGLLYFASVVSRYKLTVVQRHNPLPLQARVSAWRWRRAGGARVRSVVFLELELPAGMLVRRASKTATFIRSSSIESTAD